MRILVLMNSSDGLYLFRREIIETLLNENEVFFCGPNDGYIEELEQLGAKYIELEFNRHGVNPISEINLIKKYKRLINEIKPNIVFTYTIKPNIYGGIVCRKLGIPYVANITGLGTAVEGGGILQCITLFLYKIGLKSAQKVFFQNSENRDLMVGKKIVTGEYDILPGSGVNLERFHVEDYPMDQDINFMFISRLMKEKGIDQYLDAAEYIHGKHPNTIFHICGSCEKEYDRTRLDELINKGIVIYHGVVHDIKAMHKISACTVHPTYYPEGLSNVLLESCACGRPIITTNRSGCKEVVVDGVNGYVVKEKDSNDLVKKIERFLKLSAEERKQMGLAGRKKVEMEFSRQVVINKYLEEIGKLQ